MALKACYFGIVTSYLGCGSLAFNLRYVYSLESLGGVYLGVVKGCGLLVF